MAAAWSPDNDGVLVTEIARRHPNSFFESYISSMDEHKRSVAKAISWRITGTLDTFIISFIITGTLKMAGAIAATEVITKIALYYFHERVWDRISFGRQIKDAS